MSTQHIHGTITLVIMVMLGVGNDSPATAQDRGERMFQQSCTACHTIGGGQLVGPDLAGVTEQRPEDWLISFIQSSQSMIQAGDPVAEQLFEEYNQMVMPDQPYSASEVRGILAYIHSQSGGVTRGTDQASDAAQTDAAEGAPPASDSVEAMRRGADLFVGRARFAHGGTACNACHTVDVAGVTTGGALAAELTTAYARLSEAGLRGIITNPPFPAMKHAMGGTPTDEETDALIAFLKVASEQGEAAPSGTNFARLLLLGGLGGFGMLLLFAAIAWSGRARRAVNHPIYARQGTST